MREIKFRGQMTTGEWVYGYLTKDIGGSTAYYKECSYRISWYPDTGGQANAPVKNDTIGQFTGRHDRDGSEIYEGDMVLFTWWWFDGQERDSELTGTIVYSEENMSFQLKGVKNAEWERFMGFENDREYLTPFSELMFEDADFRVVGNIHDNHELLTIGGKE